MDTVTGSCLMEEFELMKQSKYRVYMQNIDKALKNFEYSSEWADLISALGKLNKVISSYPQYQVIPRRIKISKRLSQCMHPALPSGVHLKALETYDIIFNNTGTERLASDLFIYSSGLFPLMQYASMNVRPYLLEIYEKYFVPLGERLQPALSGFLSGVLPGLEAGVDHFDRTSNLLNRVCVAVNSIYFHTCIWECVATNSSIRLPAITYVIDNYNKRVGIAEQSFLIGKNIDLMISGLCACLNDSLILVQRNTLEFLLLGFPLHTTILSEKDLTKLVANALNTILRRDMSLNRRVYSWLLGTEVINSKNLTEKDAEIKKSEEVKATSPEIDVDCYFEKYSKKILIKAIKISLRNSISNADLKPFKILLSLLDKVEIGPVILNDILIDVMRTTIKVNNGIEVKKSVNSLFGNFDPSYIWRFLTSQLAKACSNRNENQESEKLSDNLADRVVKEIDSGDPDVVEICYITECLLEILSLEMFNETTRVCLPRMLFSIVKILSHFSNKLTSDEVTSSINLCIQIIKHIQPMILCSTSETSANDHNLQGNNINSFHEQTGNLEKSKSDSKINQTAMDEPIKRSRSNYSMMGGKKSPKKKKSKSSSKLHELDKEIFVDTENVFSPNNPNTVSTPNLDNENEKLDLTKKNLKSPKLLESTSVNENDFEVLNDSKSSNELTQSEPIAQHVTTPIEALDHDNQTQKYTILERCSKQFEIFFQVYFSKQILKIGNNSGCSETEDCTQDDFFFSDTIIQQIAGDEMVSITNDLFSILKIDTENREHKLQSLLNSTIEEQDESFKTSESSNSLYNNLKTLKKFQTSKLDQSLKRATKLINQLLVTLATIPSYRQTTSTDTDEEKDLPNWLKTLIIMAVFSKSDKDLQITCISTFFELIEIVSYQKDKRLNDNDIHHLVMLPLLKNGHIVYIESQTKIFQVLTSLLWDYLDTTSNTEYSHVALLLYRIHECLDSGVVEKVINDRILNAHLIWSPGLESYSGEDDRLSRYKTERLKDLKIILDMPNTLGNSNNNNLRETEYSGFKKFEMLWHLGRDKRESFDKILLKMYDNLGNPHQTSIRTFVLKWLKDSLLRGDFERLLKPILYMMLNSNTKRISISNLDLLKISDDKRSDEHSFDENKSATESYKSSIPQENEMYVIKMEDGAVKNHLESTKKKTASVSIPKKILNIAAKSSSAGDKMREKGLLPVADCNEQPILVENHFDSIELFVNPLEHQQDKGIFMSKSEPSSSTGKAKKVTIDSSSEYSTSAESLNDNESEHDDDSSIIDESIKLKNSHSDGERHQIKSYDESGTAADEYFLQTAYDSEEHFDECKNSSEATKDTQNGPFKLKKKITRETLEKGKANTEILKKNFDELEGFFHNKLDRFHSFHTHLLLYDSCYDTKQIIYCMETLRNIITAGNSKLFICLSINTCVSDVGLKHLLVRHRKSIFGKGFDGSFTNSEFNNAYKGVMYLEVLITLCLYYARSYYQLYEQGDPQTDRLHNNEKPTQDEILANSKIQLFSIDLLNLIFSELIPIVKEMGKGLASYIADLMAKCKVQKVILHCVLTSIHYLTAKVITTKSEKILKFNDPGSEKMHLEAIQIQLLKLLDTVVKLEHETVAQKGEQDSTGSAIKPGASVSSILSQSPTRPKSMTKPSDNLKYIQNLTITQQPMFLIAALNALASDNLRHLHKNWTELVTSTLNYVSAEVLSNIIVSITHQLCDNLDQIIKISSNQNNSDYCISQLEALTVICHFCLLDNNQQVSLSHLFNPQTTSLSTQLTSYGQIYNNILNFFLSSSPLQIGEAYNRHQLQHNATRVCVLSHLPRIIASMLTLWESKLGQNRLVKQQLIGFLSPIALHHSCNFVASLAVVWHEKAEKKMQKNQFKFQDPANAIQLSLVYMTQQIKVIPFDSIVQTVNSVLKSPPQIYRPPDDLTLSVSVLEFFFVYMKSIKNESLNDSWVSLMNLFKDSTHLSPRAQFMIFCILHQLVKDCSPYERKDKKDIRELHDITTRLIESLSNIAGACLEQTTWLRRNLAVKEEASDDPRDGSLTQTGSQQYSVEAQSLLSYNLVNVLDYAFGSQEKEKIVTIISTLMYNVIPYLKNHTPKNTPFFYACSHLLSTLTPYQYTRKAWKKDVFDLFLDPAFFQMDASCLPFWKQILDNLMSYDNTTFRELMNRISVAQTGSLNIFTSKEQEYEQKAILLKKLAFVIYCSERDQYQKYMPEIQEQLSTCLRLPQVIPCVQAAVLLCFRVLLLRMSPDHVTSLWPTIIAEMVQVFLSIEQELMTDTEEFSQHIRMLSGLDTAWVTNSNNGVNSQNHASWRMVQLETAKLLELGCVLPASSLPHFQMYRWAFVGSQHDQLSKDLSNKTEKDSPQFYKFVPHITRIAQLMDIRYASAINMNSLDTKSSRIILTCQSVNTLQDLHGFFSTLFMRMPGPQYFFNDDTGVENILAEIENILSLDFLEKMTNTSK